MGKPPDKWLESATQGLLLLPSTRVTMLLRRHSALYYPLERGWVALQERSGCLPRYREAMRQRFGDAQAPASVAAEQKLRALARLARERGVPLGIVLFPQLGDVDALGFLHERVLALCARERLTCLDLRPLFAREDRGQALRVNRFDAHPGPRAHALAADAIAAHFAPVWPPDR